MKVSAEQQTSKWKEIPGIFVSEADRMYLESDASQSECLEISLGSFHRTQNKTFLTGADVVLTVTVKRTHTDGKKKVKKRRKRWLGLRVSSIFCHVIT